MSFEEEENILPDIVLFCAWDCTANEAEITTTKAILRIVLRLMRANYYNLLLSPICSPTKSGISPDVTSVLEK
jgi:hypothetical protein